MSKISPLAPKTFPQLPEINGVKLAVSSAAVKYENRTDLMLAVFSEGTVVAGAFTKSKTASANILWGREALSQQTARILVVNSGNANAFNGKCGEESVARIVKFCADLWNINEKEVYPCATGVIGEPLPDEKITGVLSKMKGNLASDAFADAADAIRTTDTFSKGSARVAIVAGKEVKISGIAKGSGMIAPDMATMLSYIFTDAAIDQEILQDIFLDLIDDSFNSITVDSDTSTSDTALVFATGKALNEKITKENIAEIGCDFKNKLSDVLLELAHLIVKDGEGATKFVKITVKGAENDRAAKTIALSIANSPLVKTAIAGEDANWGRIVMAVGKSGEEANRDKMAILIGGVIITQNGQLNPDYQESDVTEHMQGQNIDIEVDVGIAGGKSTVWTCDLTHDYITINADYRS